MPDLYGFRIELKILKKARHTTMAGLAVHTGSVNSPPFPLR